MPSKTDTPACSKEIIVLIFNVVKATSPAVLVQVVTGIRLPASIGFDRVFADLIGPELALATDGALLIDATWPVNVVGNIITRAFTHLGLSERLILEILAAVVVVGARRLFLSFAHVIVWSNLMDSVVLFCGMWLIKRSHAAATAWVKYRATAGRRARTHAHAAGRIPLSHVRKRSRLGRLKPVLAWRWLLIFNFRSYSTTKAR